MFGAFADCRVSGEMQYYAQSARGQYLPKSPDLRERRPTQRFFAWTSALPLGDIPTYSITKNPVATNYSVGRGLLRSGVRVEQLVRPYEFFSLGGLFGAYPIVTPPWLTHDYGSYYSRLLQFWSLDEKMRGSGAHWIPVWASNRYVRISPADNTAVAGYLAADKTLLLQISNLVDQSRDVIVQLLSPTGLAAQSLRISQQVTAGSRSKAKIVDGKVRVHLQPGGYARFVLTGPVSAE